MGEGLFYCCRCGYEIVEETVSETLCGGEDPVLGLRQTMPKMRTLGARVDYLKFNDWYREERARLHNFAVSELCPAAAAEAEAAGGSFTERSLVSSYELKLISGQFCSILLRSEWDVGEGGCGLSAQNWLIRCGRMITLGELFRPGCRVGQLTASQIRSAGYDPSDFPEKNFYLTESRLVLFSKDCPAAAEVAIPLEKLRCCLRPELYGGDRPFCDDGCLGIDGMLSPIDLPPLCR